jgi:hypothetical protein
MDEGEKDMKKILSTILLALVLLSIMVSKGFCQIIVTHKDVVSKYQCFTATVYVYQDLDSMATEDFYAFWMRVHGNDTVYDFVWVTIENTEGICDVWQPTEGVSLGGSVTLTIGYISIGVNLIPISYTAVDGEYTNTISWFFDAQDVDDAEFAAGFWVPEGSPLHFTITIRAMYFVPSLDFPVWDDTATWSSTTHPQLSISASSGGTTDPSPGTYTYGYGSSVTVTAYAYAYHTFDGWILDGSTIIYDNPITVTMDSDHTLDAYFSVSGGGGSGGGEPCPTLFVWDDNDYVDYGVIDIHNPSGEDVIREVAVQTEDVGIINYKAKFRLREGWEGLNFSESVIDQVKLYAVGKNGNRYLCPLTSAMHNTLGKVLPQLLLSDDYRVQILLLETIDLEFAVPYKNVQGYTFTIEGCNKWKM